MESARNGKSELWDSTLPQKKRTNPWDSTQKAYYPYYPVLPERKRWSSCTESGHAKSEFRKIRILIFLSADTLARNPDNLSDEIVEDAVPTAVGFISIFHPE
jgi:hypothetical protein